MLPQVPERLTYEGKRIDLPFEQPLEAWFEQSGNRPDFAVPHTALWRGYVASWELRKGKLYLTSIEGMLTNGRQATLQTVFPDATGDIFAHWYSGSFRLPEGELPGTICIGYSPVYGRYLVLTIENGILISSHHENDDELGNYGV